MLPGFQVSLNNNYFTPNNCDELFNKFTNCQTIQCATNKINYCNIIASFDIENTSFYNNDDEKVSIMYVWALGINGYVIIGRTWEEFTVIIKKIVSVLKLHLNKRMIIYVHYLSHEFQFFKHLFIWDKVFAVKERTPLYALTTSGIEFRCSYLLTGYALDSVADNLVKYKLEKLKGFDYSKIRHSATPLTDEEISYCIHDVLIVMCAIDEKIDIDGDITKIPYTKTGYVRRLIKNNCFYDFDKNGKKIKNYKRLKFIEIMKSLTFTPEQYKLIRRAFVGGFTHCNPFYSHDIMTDVTSYDLTSSYPTVMIAEKFPMSKPIDINIKSENELIEVSKHYNVIFDVIIEGLEPIFYSDNYLSLSHCIKPTNYQVNNGRIVSADSLLTTLTEVDYKILKKFYKWNRFTIVKAVKFYRDYLPKDIVLTVLQLYQKKTLLKGIPEKEIEYLYAKELINACYGNFVTDIVRDTYEYVNEKDWITIKDLFPDITDRIKYKKFLLEESVKKYNNSRSRSIYYPWGVYVTAYARRNLMSAIIECGEDYIYSDTDSVKLKNYEKHKAYFEKYNQLITNQLQNAVKYHNISKELLCPYTIDNKPKPLGVWDFDGHYARFIALRAKCYMGQYSNNSSNGAKKGKYLLTISGVNKHKGMKYLLKQYGDNCFNYFNENLTFPASDSGRITHTYIDTPRQGTVIDYTGLSNSYYERSSVHLENSTFTLQPCQEYIDFLRVFKEGLY